MPQVQFTGVRDIDNIIDEFKGNIKLFNVSQFLTKSSLYLLSNYYHELDKISLIENLRWDTLHKLDNENTIFMRRHNSYVHLIMSFMISFFFVCIIGVYSIYEYRKLHFIHIIWSFIIFFFLSIYTIYHLFFSQDIVIISFNIRGISLYKGSMTLPIKRLHKSTFTYEELPLIIKKCKYTWTTHVTHGWGSTLINHYGFASMILINKTDYNKLIIFENYHQESDVCPSTIHRQYIDDKRLLRNILDFPFRFEAYGENDNKILEGVQVKLISTL